MLGLGSMAAIAPIAEFIAKGGSRTFAVI